MVKLTANARRRPPRRVPAPCRGRYLPLMMVTVVVTVTVTVPVDALKIAFVGDTGMWGEESNGGYGQRTFDMISSQQVDLVIHVGDFDYWGRCTEEYVFGFGYGGNAMWYTDDVQDDDDFRNSNNNIFDLSSSSQTQMLLQQQQQQQRPPWDVNAEPYTIYAEDDDEYRFVPDGRHTIRRYRWQYGRHDALEGWEVGIVSRPFSQPSRRQDPDLEQRRPAEVVQRFVVSHSEWIRLRRTFSRTMTLLPGEQDCYDDPWDGPWEWNQFMRGYDFDFLGSSGNVEVREGPTYGSPEIWADHQRYLYDLYQQRIVQTNRGECRGYHNSSFPGTPQEYGERFSCFYGDDGDHHILFLGWYQGSDEHWQDESTLARQQSIDFINREFGSSEDRVQNAKWRYCIHHMTSAKLSAGDASREHMELSGITDACRKHGALIFNGHHHLYSRTKMLQGVGGLLGDESIAIAPESLQNTVQEGNTMSVTVGMGGFDGACNGKYANEAWMEKCVASWDQHRGAVIAEFNDKEPWKGTFQYINSLANASVVDEFQLISRLPGAIRAPSPSVSPTDPPRQADEGNIPLLPPSQAPTEESSTSKPEMIVPEGIAGPKPEENIAASSTMVNASKASSPFTTKIHTSLCTVMILAVSIICA